MNGRMNRRLPSLALALAISLLPATGIAQIHRVDLVVHGMT